MSMDCVYTSLRGTDLKVGDIVIPADGAFKPGLTSLASGVEYRVKQFVNRGTPMDSPMKCIGVETLAGVFAGQHHVKRFNKKEARMGINKNVKHKVGDKVIAVDTYPPSNNGKEHTITAVDQRNGTQWVAIDGGKVNHFGWRFEKKNQGVKASDLKVGDTLVSKATQYGGPGKAGDEFIVRSVGNQFVFADNLTSGKTDVWMSDGDFLDYVEKKRAPRQFQPGDIVRRTGKSDWGFVQGYTYEVTEVNPSNLPHGGCIRAKGVVSSGDINKFELVTAVEDLPKPAEPKVAVTKRYMTDATVFDATDAQRTLTIGYDPLGSVDDSGPCIDFEVTNPMGLPFNGIDIEDLETLDAVIRVLTSMREMFVNDTK